MTSRRAFVISVAIGAMAVLLVLLVSTWMGALWSRGSRTGDDTGPVGAPMVFPNAACAEAYTRLFEESELRVTVAFGYKDSRPSRFVADLYERALWVQALTRKCEGSQGDDGRGEAVCGFVPVPETDGDFVRTRWLGPDGRLKRIRLRVLQGSVGPDDQMNRRSPLQAAHSRRTWEAFLAALHEDQVVFYNGHSRNGGGPDFFPPKMNSVGVVDYEAYRTSPERLREFFSAVAEGRRIGKLRLLGLLSCDSRQFFARKLGERVAGDLPLLSSRKLMYFSDSLAALEEALSALMRAKCQAEWSSSGGTRLGLTLEKFF